MTLNSKVLSLVLLSGLTMGGAFAKIQTSSAAAGMKAKASALREGVGAVAVAPVAVQANTGTCATCTSTPAPCTACPTNLCVPAFCPPACPTCPPTPCSNTPGSACFNLCLSNTTPAIPCNLEVIEPLCYKAYLTPTNIIAGAGITAAGTVTARGTDLGVSCATLELCFDSGLETLAYRFIATGSNVRILTTVESYTAAVTFIADLNANLLPFPGIVSNATPATAATAGYNRISLTNGALISADGTCLSKTGVITHEDYRINSTLPAGTISEINSLWSYAQAISKGWVQIVARNSATQNATSVVLQGTPVAAAAAA